MNVGSLTAEQAMLVEATAQATAERVVELLCARGPVVASRHLLSAAELAAELGVARSFVYEHADELGAVRLGEGAKPRLRFDPDRARAAVSCSEGGRSQDESASGNGRSEVPASSRRRRLPNGLPKPGSVLVHPRPGGEGVRPIRGYRIVTRSRLLAAGMATRLRHDRADVGGFSRPACPPKPAGGRTRKGRRR